VLSPAAAERASESFALDVVAVLAGATLTPERWRRIQELSPEIHRALTTAHGLCGSPALREIQALARLKGWPQATLLRLLSIGDPTAPWLVHETPHFRINYQTEGSSPVPPDTGAADVIDPGSDPPSVVGHLPSTGIPTYVTRVAFWAEGAFDVYRHEPFALRDPTRCGGKIDLLLGPFCLGTTAAARCPGQQIFVDASANPGLLCALVAHEVFHAFQYDYAVLGDRWFAALVEGGAVFAEDYVAGRINRYIHEAGPARFNGAGALAVPGLPLATKACAYKSSLLWRYLAEQHGSPAAYRRVWEAYVAGASVEDAVRAVFGRPLLAFEYVGGGPGGDLVSGETLFGNYALACFLKDVPGVLDGRFTFQERADAVHFADFIANEPPQAMMAPVHTVPLAVGPGTTPVALALTLPAFSHAYYAIRLAGGVGAVDVELAAAAPAPRHIFQMVALDTAGRVQDIHRSDARVYARRVDVRSLSRLLVIVTGGDDAGDYTLSVAPATPAPAVRITRWNCAEGTGYETDPAAQPWTMASPDLWVEAPHPWMITDAAENRVAVRLRNVSGVDAAGVAVDLSWQPGGATLDVNAWQPMLDEAGRALRLDGIAVPAGQARRVTASWLVALPAGVTAVCLRAAVTAPGDPNTDDKRALSMLTVSRRR
jgi:hypothetical protein